MTAVILLWVKFWGTLCARVEKNPVLQNSLHGSTRDHRSHMSSRAHSGELPFKALCPSTLSSFHWRAQPHFLTQTLIFPWEISYIPQHLFSGNLQGCFKKGRVKNRACLQPSLSCCQRGHRGSNTNSGLFASTKHKTGRPKNKQKQCNS